MVRKIISIVAVAVVCFALLIPLAQASEVDEETSFTEQTIIEVTEPAPVETQEHIVSVDVVRSVSPVTPQNANGLKKILLQTIGNYEMVTCEYTYTSSSGYTSKQVTTECDYAWIISAALFIIVLWSLFRFVGGLMTNAKR